MITYIFITRQTLYVEILKIDGYKQKDKDEDVKTRWLSEDEIKEAAICKTVHKCLALINKPIKVPKVPKPTSSSPKKKKTKTNENNEKQQKMTNFFKSKQ